MENMKMKELHFLDSQQWKRDKMLEWKKRVEKKTQRENEEETQQWRNREVKSKKGD